MSTGEKNNVKRTVLVVIVVLIDILFPLNKKSLNVKHFFLLPVCVKQFIAIISVNCPALLIKFFPKFEVYH